MRFTSDVKILGCVTSNLAIEKTRVTALKKYILLLMWKNRIVDQINKVKTAPNSKAVTWAVWVSALLFMSIVSAQAIPIAENSSNAKNLRKMGVQDIGVIYVEGPLEPEKT